MFINLLKLINFLILTLLVIFLYFRKILISFIFKLSLCFSVSKSLFYIKIFSLLFLGLIYQMVDGYLGMVKASGSNPD